MRIALLFTLLCSVAWAGAKGSAFRKETKLGANYWAASQAVDGKLETAWMVPGESSNKGEWIEIDIPQGTVDKIAIFPGFNKSEETWGDYPRIKQMRVDIQALDETPEERKAVHPECFFDDAMDAKLTAWIQRRYRDDLAPEDLADPKLLDESRTALDELTRILGLGALYEFQRDATTL